MVAKFCSSCGREGEPKKYYCRHCGGFLVPKGNKILGEKFDYSKYSPFIDKPPRKRLFTRNFYFGWVRFFLRISLIAILAVLILAVMEPESPLPAPTQPQSDAAYLVAQSLELSKKGGSTVLTDTVINSYLLLKGGPSMKPVFNQLPEPQWKSSRLILEDGEITCFLEFTLFDYPIIASEKFQLSGSPFHWSLEPIVGSIGQLPFSGAFLRILTPLFEYYVSPVNAELHQIARSGILIIHPGSILFGGQ